MSTLEDAQDSVDRAIAYRWALTDNLRQLMRDALAPHLDTQRQAVAAWDMLADVEVDLVALWETLRQLRINLGEIDPVRDQQRFERDAAAALRHWGGQ